MPSVEVWLSAWSVVKIHLSEVKRCDASVCADRVPNVGVMGRFEMEAAIA